MKVSRLPIPLFLTMLLCQPAWPWQAPQKPSFGKDIAPVLAQCVQCHGQESPQGKLDLRTRESALQGGAHGPAIQPGSAAESNLYRRLLGQQQPQMPLGGRLHDVEIAAIRVWIDAGAEWDPAIRLGAANSTAENKFTSRQRRYWAFQKVVKPAEPALKSGKPGSPVDAFIKVKLEEKGIQPNPPADRITLLRRATLDLTGLPPSPEETQAFLADRSAAAFAKVVDRLLASPRYGERWGRHWLDLARYADTGGFKEDAERPDMWRYRDYVIRAFNQDKPYDRFIREQIAGDEIYPEDLDARIATGFSRHFPEELGAQVIESKRQDMLNDITDTVGAVFLGMTFGCARCHDHKFDPILQRDYYQLQAFFANLRSEDRAMLVAEPERRAYEERYAAWEAKARPTREAINKLLAPALATRMKQALARFPEEVRQACLIPPEKRTPYQRMLYVIAKPQIEFDDASLARSLKGEDARQFQELASEFKELAREKPVGPPVAQTVMDLGAEAPKTYVLAGGNWEAPKEEVQPGYLTIIDPRPPRIVPPSGLHSTGRRTALANWLADPHNPLTARVMVNRIWQHHFGRGIVATPSDFGLMGEKPSDLPLLDYLAASFVESGWSIKQMHRLIMLSSVYQESASYQAAAAAADPDNHLLWRYERHRLESEAIRDSTLFVSGILNLKAGGPGIHPPLPAGSTPPRFGEWQVEKGDETNRRSVYVFVKRNLIYPMFAAFDAPNAQETCARRFRTVVPTQSLTLMNDELALEWAQRLAGRVLDDSGLSPQQQIERVYRIVYSRAPKPEEEKAVEAFLDRQTSLISARLANQEKVPMPIPAVLSDRVRAGAFVDLCAVLLNSNEFLYIN
jgi:hypothetical protein